MTDATTTEDAAGGLPEWLIRRGQIIRLLETMNDGLPEPVRRDHSTSGFVNEARSRSCPDCLANGRVMFGCETCGGSGEVAPERVDAIALVDALADDGEARDPYAKSETVQAYGVQQTTKLGHVPARDAEEARLAEQTRPPFKNPQEELDHANKHPYVWERERAAMRKRYDIDALRIALDELRIADEAGYHLLHSVYVYGWSEPSATMEMVVERALTFVDALMPTPIRAPGDEPVVDHPAAARIRSRKAA